MKKKMFGLMAAVLLVSGCGKIPKLENGQEAVVSFKNGDMISVDDLYKEIKDTYGLSTLITMIDKYVLEKTFPDYIDTAKEYSESFVSALRENYESEEELLSAIQSYTGMSSLEAYQDYMYISYMDSHAAEEYAKLQITDKQINDYYKNDVVGDIEVSHILITPEVTDDMSDEDKEKAENKAMDKAKDIISKLKAASKDEITTLFEKLAKENSNDDATKNDGGKLGKINKGTLSSEYDELIEKAYSIKDGEFSTDVITTELGYHVILRTKSYDKASLEDTKDNIIKTLAEKLVSEDNTTSYNALQYYRKELGMNIEDSNLQTQYGYYMNNLLNNLNNSNN